MKIVTSCEVMQALSKMAKQRKERIGFIPTMGALHEGHLSLIRQARKDNNIVVVSIFVNPTQFGPKEDFKKYPRDFKKDALLCKKEGVDILFCPRNSDIYPEGYTTFVSVEGLSNILCGASRPGHFRGVATIVTKLFNIVIPDISYFGQKDAQQAAIIKKLAKELNFPLGIKVLPIVRQKDGLAMSSRNRYLNPQEREEAVVLYDSLKLAKALIKKGILDADRIKKAIRDFINEKELAKIDYIAVVDKKDFQHVKEIKRGCLVLLAVFIGKTRLIDNIIVN